MRISNNILSNNFLYALNQNMQSQADVQQQMSSGKKVNKASDDPVVTAKSLMYNANLAENEKFSNKATDATSFLETTDGAMSSLEEVLIRAKELTVKASSTNSKESYNAIATEIDSLVNTAMQIGNTAIGDRYIFAGTNDRKQPFAYENGGDVGSPITYSGDDGKISMRLQTGKNVDSQDAVNVSGSALFGKNNEVLKSLQDVSALLKSNSVAGIASSGGNLNQQLSGKLAELDAGLTNVLEQHSYIGARMNDNDTRASILARNNTTITKVLGDNEDLDPALASVQAKSLENIYQMALSVGSKILPKSLLDFLS